MTQRERQTPEGGAHALPRPVADRPAANGLAGWWDELFPGIPATRQQELLAIAGRQGLLYAHQLGAINAVPVPHYASVASLLGGIGTSLAPLTPPATTSFDLDLDDAQREAVARALHTPDICLIQGEAGTGKSRVVAEIIAQAGARGERVLFLAPNPAALDCVLERIGTNESLCPVRCLAADERPDALPGCIRRLTLAERLGFFEDRTLGAARQSLQEARQLCDTHRRNEPVWPRLENAVETLTRLAAEAANLAVRRDTMSAAVAAEAKEPCAESESAFHRDLAIVAQRRSQTLTHIADYLSKIQAETDKAQSEAQRLDGELQPLLQLAEAKRAGKWWTLAWWRATFGGDVVTKVEQLQGQIQQLRLTTASLAEDTASRVAYQTHVEKQTQQESDDLVRVEAARRIAGLDVRMTALDAERLEAETTWHVACGEFTDVSLIPAASTADALRTKRTEWEGRRREDEERHAAAVHWTAELEQALAAFPDKLARCVNVVAATPRGLTQDSRFGDNAVPMQTFDLLILEEAELVTEADFVHAARRARRWVLVGEPQPDAELAAKRSGPGKTIRPNALRPGFFQRLWRELRWDPRRLPYTWEQRDSRLHCRLRAVAPEEESSVQSERLADRPDVELFILSRRRHEPELVEVVFPASISVPEAKEFLFRELGEVTLQVNGPDWHWAEQAERVVLRLTPCNDANAVLVLLCAGVRELVAPMAGDENDETADWRTCAVEFDRADGWDRARAQQWAVDHLRLRDPGRATRLTAPHRTRPVLASWLSHLLHGDALPRFSPAGEPAFEFVAVPSFSSNGEPRRHGPSEAHWQNGGGAALATRSRPVKSGAGLETDLAVSRRIDQLPADLAATLPARGIVNLLEAQALIHCLEGLLADESFRAAAERWQQCQAQPCERAGAVCASRQTVGRPAHRPAVAVIALYSAQAELIVRLLQRVPVLLASPVTVEVGPPSAFRHRECLTALVSLTRSHTHRAVPFGDGPQALALALTRAAERVLLFGDPGTLARRSHWQGGLDHLDEVAAERERALSARIVTLIHGTEAIPPGFRLREGNLV